MNLWTIVQILVCVAGVEQVCSLTFNCYECKNCAANITTVERDDVLSEVRHCQRCLKAMATKTAPIATRLCLSQKKEHRLHDMGYDVSNGCRDVTNFPGLRNVGYLCFCSWELCNETSSLTINASLMTMVMIVATLFAS